MAETRLPCCERGARFARLRHASELFYDSEYENRTEYLVRFRETPPSWMLVVESLRDAGLPPHTETVPFDFCPFCGTKVPPVRLRAREPKKLCVVLDSGYYCDTCKRRLMECRCAMPDQLWEIDPCTG